MFARTRMRTANSNIMNIDDSLRDISSYALRTALRRKEEKVIIYNIPTYNIMYTSRFMTQHSLLLLIQSYFVKFSYNKILSGKLSPAAIYI